jgi:hypothetical protein
MVKEGNSVVTKHVIDETLLLFISGIKGGNPAVHKPAIYEFLCYYSSQGKER